MMILTDSNFDEEIKKAVLPVLVDFYADWCGPCKLMAPHIEEIARELETKIVVSKFDVDANPNTAQKFGIMSIPTTIIFKNGQPAKQMVGYQDKEALIKAINEVK